MEQSNMEQSNPQKLSAMPAPPTRPDFQELMEVLTKEVELNLELSNQIFDLTNQFKNFRVPEPESNSKLKEPEGIIDHFWGKLIKIRMANNILQKSANGLSSIIGS